jgi:hypothetical protein
VWGSSGSDNTEFGHFIPSYPIKVVFVRSDRNLALRFFWVDARRNIHDSLLESSIADGTYPLGRYSRDALFVPQVIMTNFFPSALPAEVPRVDPVAYTHVLPTGVGDIHIALPPDIAGLLGQNWTITLSNHDGVDRALGPTADWNYNESLAHLNALAVQLAQALELAEAAGNVELAQALQEEINALRQIVLEQGVLTVGSIQSLNDAMIEAGLVIQFLQQQLSLGLVQIEEMAIELARAHEAIRQLTDGQPITPPPVTPPIVAPIGGIDWSPLMNIPSLIGVFPFSIPFDFIDMVSMLRRPPQAPVFEIPLVYPGVFEEVIVVDFSIVEDIVPLVRFLILAQTVVFLAWVTSKVIKW